jgi:hypothetical protein
METLGSLIDRLQITNHKMWFIQDNLYDIANITFDEFWEKYCKDKEGAYVLFSKIKRAIDLNKQRNVLIDEIDEMAVEMILSIKGKDDGEFYINRKHKSY